MNSVNLIFPVGSEIVSEDLQLLLLLRVVSLTSEVLLKC